MRRSFERAGNRLRGRAGPLRELLRHVPPMHCTATLGLDQLTAAGLTADELLAEAWSDTDVLFRKWTTATFDEALNLSGGFIGGWDVGLHEAMVERFAINVEDAVDMMHRGLTGIARDALFADPALTFAPGAPDLVPAGFVRQITAIAGGTTDIESSGFAYVALTNAGTEPAGGVATGSTIMDGLDAAGATRQGYRWVYGPAVRMSPFEPHQALDGVTFENFDDPVLANHGNWPPFAFYMPGDHDYCRCDFEPIILPPKPAPAPAPEVSPAPAIAQPAAQLVPPDAELSAARGAVDDATAESLSGWSSSSYRLTSAMREGARVPPAEQKIAAALDRIAAPTPRDMVVYRGVPADAFPDGLPSPGAVFSDKAYATSTTSLQDAEDLFGPNGMLGSGDGAILVIETPGGTTGSWLGGITNYSEVDEMGPLYNEFVFPPNTRMRVLGVDERDGVPYVSVMVER